MRGRIWAPRGRVDGVRAVRVVNWSRGVCLAAPAAVADRWWERGRGLLGQAGLAQGAGLLIIPCNSIHSCFMRFPFDAAFIDREYQVLHLIHAMPPNRVSRIVRRSWAVLELPAGVLQATGTQTGDQLAVLDLP